MRRKRTLSAVYKKSKTEKSNSRDNGSRFWRYYTYFFLTLSGNGNIIHIIKERNMTDLRHYGYSEAGLPSAGLHPGRITAVHRARYELICREGFIYGRLKTSVYYSGSAEPFPTVGDFVHIQMVDGGDSQIVKTLPRKSVFIRRDPYAGEQVVAANFDYVFIMTSLNQDFNLKRLERYLILARQSGAVPVVVLTKADLSAEYAAQVSSVQAIAEDADVIPVSAVSGVGLDRLNIYLAPGKTIVFLGMSGVGKSSLLNTLMGQEVMAVNAIREDDSRGRHTTTHRQLFMLPSGAMVIDTPGMRSVGLWDSEAGLGETFADLEKLPDLCRFSDCRHETEPGCAVRAAIESGVLSAERWERYQKLRREAEYSESKSDFMRKRQEWAKNIAKFQKQREKNGKRDNNK